MEIRPVAIVLTLAGRRTSGKDEGNRRFSRLTKRAFKNWSVCTQNHVICCTLVYVLGDNV